MENLTEIALFPIPDMVAFPGATVPLHVFEPRYRRMINECVDSGRLLGVCHTRKTIRTAPTQQSVEQALSSNQATYQPQSVFSAGECRVQQTLDDGRILVTIHMSNRYRIISQQQTLPYVTALCEPVADVEMGQMELDSAQQLKDGIIKRLLAIVQDAGDQVPIEELQSHWGALSSAAFSFSVFELVRFDPDLMQTILEITNPVERLQTIADVIQAA